MSRDGRARWLENPSFRAHLFWVVTGTAGSLLVVVSAAIMFPLFLRFDHGLASPAEMHALTERILDLHATLWPVVGVCLLAVMVSSWLLYQRMVSPLVRFVRSFDAVRDGQLPQPVHLRATDYLTREADSLNGMTQALRERQADLEAAHAELRAAIEELGEWAASQGDPEAARRLAELEQRDKALADRIARVVAD